MQLHPWTLSQYFFLNFKRRRNKVVKNYVWWHYICKLQPNCSWWLIYKKKVYFCCSYRFWGITFFLLFFFILANCVHDDCCTSFSKRFEFVAQEVLEAWQKWLHRYSTVVYSIILPTYICKIYFEHTHMKVSISLMYELQNGRFWDDPTSLTHKQISPTSNRTISSYYTAT